MAEILDGKAIAAEVRAGRFPIALIDEAVRRTLRIKAALGLFDDPYRGTSVERETRDLLTPAHRQAAREIARHKHNRLPVVDDGALFGIVTRADVVRAFTRTDAESDAGHRGELFDRTLGVVPTEVITISPGAEGRNPCVVSLDGRESRAVPPGGQVRVTRGAAPVRMARLMPFDFYDRIREKFGLL